MKLRKWLDKMDSPRDLLEMPMNRMVALPGWEEKYEAILKRERLNYKDREKEYSTFWDRGIFFYSHKHPSFPERLRNIPHYPWGIYVKGKLPSAKQPAVAIVGARGCSHYGKQVAEDLGYALGARGVLVISGMAHGIDAAGQYGALEAGGESYGVLGSGVDICYPAENLSLYRRLQACGGVLSETPPGEAGKPFRFPRRNRIISGLSDVVVVVEGKMGSGSFSTVEHALSQNKDIFAVPGRILDPLGQGCNYLLQQGAQVYTCADDVLQFLHLLENNREEKETNFLRNHKTPETLTKNDSLALVKEEYLLYSCLDFQPRHVEELLLKSGLPVSDILFFLTQMERKGLVEQPVKNYFCRKAR